MIGCQLEASICVFTPERVTMRGSCSELESAEWGQVRYFCDQVEASKKKRKCKKNFQTEVVIMSCTAVTTIMH